MKRDRAMEVNHWLLENAQAGERLLDSGGARLNIELTVDLFELRAHGEDAGP
jgi:hypothetical protein